MARKNRNLASFEELANNNIGKTNDVKVNETNNVEVSNNINNNANVNVNNDVEKHEDYLDKLIEGSPKKKESTTVLTGIYLQKDLSQVLDRLAKKGGRGAKSRIVNEALKAVFKEKGLL